ncbi:unnamed protein product [Ixodes persulcatus]
MGGMPTVTCFCLTRRSERDLTFARSSTFLPSRPATCLTRPHLRSLYACVAKSSFRRCLTRTSRGRVPGTTPKATHLLSTRQWRMSPCSSRESLSSSRSTSSFSEMFPSWRSERPRLPLPGTSTTSHSSSSSLS